MSDKSDLNERGNHQGQFTQGVGGWAEYTVHMTETSDTSRHDVAVPPGKVIPIIFLPGVMGSNLRMSKTRKDELKRKDNRSWRPDDLMGVSGGAAILFDEDLGGWFKNATPAQRQLVFDPNETEVDYYHYTENDNRFDPNGKETLASDIRHQNVPDNLLPIPPLMGHLPSLRDFAISEKNASQQKRESPAQIARWRGWSEILFSGSYGEMLKATESFLNNMLLAGKIHPFWQLKPSDPLRGRPYQKITQILLQDPKNFGASSGNPITEIDIRKVSNCWYPVHAMGYNFLQSNSKSAEVIAERIRGLVRGYQQRGFKCNEVIVVTHSMGGLVGRALCHPDYGNMLNDNSVKLLGIYHNVMPTMGAASAYKRMRFGFQEKRGAFHKLAELEARIFGIDGQHATAILANTLAPLELLPAAAYGKDWLKVIDNSGKTLWSWPNNKQTALENIYLQPNSAWWRLINPEWVNPGNVLKRNGGGSEKVYRRLKNAVEFITSIEKTFHPSNSFASFCSSLDYPSYSDVVFKIVESATYNQIAKDIPSPENWQLLTDNAKDSLTVQAGTQILTLKLQPPDAAGDATVPSHRSARQVPGTRFIHGEAKGPGYEHQASYSDPQVLASMLYSIIQIAKTANWE